MLPYPEHLPVRAQTLTVSYVSSDWANCDDGNPDFRSPAEVFSFALLRSTGGVKVYSEGFTLSTPLRVPSNSTTGGSWAIRSVEYTYYNIFSESASGYIESAYVGSSDGFGKLYCQVICSYVSDGTAVCREVVVDVETTQGRTITEDAETDTYTGSLTALATFIAQTSAPVPTTTSATGSHGSPGTRSPAPAVSNAGDAPHNSKKIDIPAIVGGAVAGLAVVFSSILWAFILRIRRRRLGLRLGRRFASLDPFDERARETTVQVPEGQKLAPYSLTGVEQSAVEYQAEAMRKISQSRRRKFGLTGGLPVAGPSAAVPGPSAQGGSGSGGVVAESDPAWFAQLRAVVERVVEEQLRQNRRESSEAPPEYTTT
uniref:VASt domain-containing protein n=1 Tax=Mycena chlorophos TaxID=658473 RepID=A0ABQ0LEL9_MYCCL|nr:predicted protein [Mycena chlorophos]